MRTHLATESTGLELLELRILDLRRDVEYMKFEPLLKQVYITAKRLELPACPIDSNKQAKCDISGDFPPCSAICPVWLENITRANGENYS
jgi:hypothetical protein